MIIADVMRIIHSIACSGVNPDMTAASYILFAPCAIGRKSSSSELNGSGGISICILLVKDLFRPDDLRVVPVLPVLDLDAVALAGSLTEPHLPFHPRAGTPVPAPAILAGERRVIREKLS
jgi:hypothetical protein